MQEYVKLTPPVSARVHDQDQLHLFKLTVRELLRRWRMPYVEVERLSALSLLSFEPSSDFELEPAQEAELNFLLTLRRAGWGDELLLSALASLTQPYRYDAQRMLYDVSGRRWIVKTEVRERELTIEGRIQRARETGDVRTLKEIAHEAMKALVGVVEDITERSQSERS